MTDLEQDMGVTKKITQVNAELLSDEERQDLARMMEKKYFRSIGDRKISISVHATESETEVIVLVASPDESFYYPIESRIKHCEQEQSVREAQLFLLDYIDQYLEEYLLEDDQLFIPIDWTDYSHDAVDFQMKGQIFNRKLENLALEWIEGKTQ